MLRILSTLPVIAVLIVGSSLVAQEATSTDTTTEASTATEQATDTADAAAADAADADTGLAMGEEVSEDPTYIKETYGDWQLKCFRATVEGQEDLCQMYQLLKEDAGNPVAEFNMFRLPEKVQAAAGATIVVPLGTLLSEGIKISIDGGKAKSYPYSFCTMVGCFARIGLTADDLASFKKGAVAHLRIVPAQAPDQTVDIKASLSGFTAAFENVSVVNN